MKFQGIAQQGGIAFDNLTLNRRQAFLANIKDGTKIVEEVKRDVANKTAAQCRAIFGVYLPVIWDHMNSNGYDIADLVREPDGTALAHHVICPSQESIRQSLYDYCGGVGTAGERLTLSHMNVLQAMQFMTNIEDICRTNLDLILPNLDKKELVSLFPPAPQ